MDKAYSTESVITNWNGTFPNYTLTVEDLKKPLSLMGALFQVLKRMEVDEDVIVASPPEGSRNENLIYYWDLVPVINMSRVINHLMCSTLETSYVINITHFLQPSVATSTSILLVLLNQIALIESRLCDIAPHEEELFSKSDQVKELQDEKNRYKEMLNNQAVEKAEKAGRIKKLDHEIKQLEEEFRQEMEAFDQEKKEMEIMLKEDRQPELLIEQKKSNRDALIAEVEKKRAMRVYDAEDIRAQAQQLTENIQEAEEKYNTLTSELMSKEDSLKNLQSTNQNLVIASHLLHDISDTVDNLRDYETGEMECQKEELDDMYAELSECEAQYAELNTIRIEITDKRHENVTKRQHERTADHNSLREAEERDRKCKEEFKKAVQQIGEMQDLVINKYEKEREAGVKEVSNILDSVKNELTQINGAVLKKVREAKENMEAKLRK